MPIREWKERISISVECSDQELPKVVAILQGQQLLPTPIYNNITNNHTIALLPSPERSRPLDMETSIRDFQRSLING